ncbi:winged helix-turn-helix domain-containing protein [Camelliibacillus cellulosilyticus]|uniref:Winged helix-turn-helix domain-containing protein n=1 Tax=Camelliibacillus cellulosilyticus TaxID=2174486 RepID=A0ABV9GKE5_9BACL
MKPLACSRSALRRWLLNVQHLNTNDNKTASNEQVLDMIKQLECVQLDPVSVVERNQHLVLAARVSDYQPERLNALLTEGSVFEYFANAACVIPMEDYPILEPIRARRRKQLQPALDNLDKVVKDVIKQLEVDGPLPSRYFKSENRVHGYWDNDQPKTKETSLALNLLLDVGDIRVVRREGNERFFDLTERTIPQDLLAAAKVMALDEAREKLIDKYLRAYRIFDIRDSRFGWCKLTAAERRSEIEKRIKAGSIVPLNIENVSREYFILAEDADGLRDIMRHEKDEEIFDGPMRFLPPLDNLLWRRERIADLFDFDYKWEIYTPKAKRRFGPYAMPILCGDRLIGRIDPRLDRQEECLVIDKIQFEPDVVITSPLRLKVQDGLETFAVFHGVNNVKIKALI